MRPNDERKTSRRRSPPPPPLYDPRAIVKWTLAEVTNQCKSRKTVSIAANLDKDTLYHWQEGRLVKLEALVAVLDVLGYELVALPSHSPKELVKE